MIHKYRIGDSIETEAVVKEIEESVGEIPYIKQESSQVFTYNMSKKDIVYGLGENVRGINKRGWIYESDCLDNPNHAEYTHALYGAHNFFIVAGQELFGVFVDASQKVTFDIGYSLTEQIKVTVEEGGYVLYVIEGVTPVDIIKQFREMIGRSYIPPKWAFGHGQSRWGYMTESDVREVAKKYREKNVPLDMIYLDIDYMNTFKDFTVNKERFPDLEGLAKELREDGIRLIPIIDAGVKMEEGYSVYDEGMEKGYFCKKENGKEFVGGVWPGKCMFPDFLNDEARAWFGNQYKLLLDQGIEGFWNDMNEPALFFSEDHLKEIFEKLEDYKDRNLDVTTYFGLKDLILQAANNKEDYKSFYHEYKGQKIRHDRVHNLYGYHMTRAAQEAFERLEPDKRILIFSRASSIGAHRYGGIWMGDNQSWWSHLLMNLQMLPSLNMCGFLYTGADLGGFGTDTTEDLMLRWLALGIFTPLMRNHSALGTRRQEFYQFGEEEAFRNIIGLRYSLLPYLYSEFMKAVLKSEMMFWPLAFAYPKDEHARRVEDQLMIGEEVMIAPVYTQNAEGRYVYLPEEMKMYRMRSMDDMDVEILPAGHHYIEVALNEVLLFLRPNCVIPFAKTEHCVEKIDTSQVELLHFIKEKAVYSWYDDDGYEKDYDLEKNLTQITVNQDGKIEMSGAKKISCNLK